ncbi:MAG: HAD family phosphatase [Bacteroidaceae bacterium]|nr:HAD family phosphatase [Bacteroidaceae bacterium]
MIKDIVFDFGGVLIEIDTPQAINCFKALGLTNAEEYLNSYQQIGTFYSLENGDITAEKFIEDLSELCNRKITYEEAKNAWLGFIVRVQTECLDFIQQLRPQHRLSVLSNTNPFLQSWARSKDFTDEEKSLDDYFDNLYLSYKMNCSKPGEEIYRKMLLEGGMKAEEVLFIDDSSRNLEAASRVGINVLQVKNGEDWRKKLSDYLTSHNI